MNSARLNKLVVSIVAFTLLAVINMASAAADLEINTPEIVAIKASMQKRHTHLAPFYQQGVVGLTHHGMVATKDVKAAALKDRGRIKSLVTAENTDRTKLYQAIAKANGHPEWQADIQKTFAMRWINKAKAGWFYQQSGKWVKK